MPKKFQVFVSSTYNDLIDERQDTLKLILDLGHIPSGMEGFFAADQEQLTYIKKIIDECDYYVLIIAGRYGSVDGGGVSFAEREYDYAVGKGITVLAFVHNDIDSLPSSNVDTGSNAERLNLFKQRVSQGRLVSFWNSRVQLRTNVIMSFVKAIGEMPGIGWVRGNTAASEDILAQLNDFRNEVERLRAENRLLKEEMRPRVENIAPLDDEYKMGYSFYDNNNRKYHRTESLSWAAIWKLIGPSFFNPAQQATIEYCLKSHIKHVHRIPGSVYLIKTDIDTIKIQMAAYGFMRIYSAQSISGGASEYLEITDIGKSVLIELTAVRAALPRP
jgi:Domain of unknown function (DUF4062)